MSKVWVQLGENGLAARVFKNMKQCIFECAEGKDFQMEKAVAVKQIREQVWDRQEGKCIRCPNILTKLSFHLHEKLSRGKGGNYSLANSEGLCYSCHLGNRGVHPNRQLFIK